MRSLRDELIRFSLQGKTTAHILTRMLTVSKLVMTSEQGKFGVHPVYDGVYLFNKFYSEPNETVHF